VKFTTESPKKIQDINNILEVDFLCVTHVFLSDDKTNAKNEMANATLSHHEVCHICMFGNYLTKYFTEKKFGERCFWIGIVLV
jgi:hypothetical protein